MARGLAWGCKYFYWSDLLWVKFYSGSREQSPHTLSHLPFGSWLQMPLKTLCLSSSFSEFCSFFFSSLPGLPFCFHVTIVSVCIFSPLFFALYTLSYSPAFCTCLDSVILVSDNILVFHINKEGVRLTTALWTWRTVTHLSACPWPVAASLPRGKVCTTSESRRRSHSCAVVYIRKWPHQQSSCR